METLPLYCQGRETGAAEIETQPPYTVLRVRIPERPGFWRAWVVGTAGEVSAGILEPSGGTLSVRRRFSRADLSPAGTLERVEVRPAGEQRETVSFQWEPLRRLAAQPETQIRRDGDRVLLSVPADMAKPFPLPPWFCFARLERNRYIFTIGSREEPVF